MSRFDQEVIARVEASGQRMADLFLIGGHVFSSPDAGDFWVTSTYAPYTGCTPHEEKELVDFLMRLGAPTYSSTEELEDEINLYKEWELLYQQLGDVLDRYGTQDPRGHSDFYLIDDCYSTPQHKIECSSNELFSPALIEDVQKLLRRYARRWEVIFVLPPVDGRDHGFRVYSDVVIEHNG